MSAEGAGAPPPPPPVGPPPPPPPGSKPAGLWLAAAAFAVVGVVGIGLIVAFLLASASGNSGSDGGPDDVAVPPIDDPAEQGSPPAPDETSSGDTDMAQMTEPWDPECPKENGEPERHLQWTEPPPLCIHPPDEYAATLHTDRGDIVIELDSARTPVTVNSFIFLARWRFYDGVDFHRVVPEFVIQTGDPVGDPPGTGGPGYTFEDELPGDGLDYPLYSVAMANAGPATNGSQFFIVTGTTVDLPPDYTVFGQVVEGQDVVDEIDATGHRAAGQAGSGHDGTPREATTIESVTITQT